MTAALTSLGWDTCKDFARSAWTYARASAHPSITRAANVIGVDQSHASRWESPKADHPVPLAVLWSRELVPDAQLEALIEQLRADRGAEVERSVLATPEGALRRTMRQAHDLVGRVMAILEDRKVTMEERAEARIHLDDMIATCKRTQRALTDADRAELGATSRGGRRR